MRYWHVNLAAGAVKNAECPARKNVDVRIARGAGMDEVPLPKFRLSLLGRFELSGPGWACRPAQQEARWPACLPRLHRTDPTAPGKTGDAAVGLAFRRPGAAELAPGPVPAAQGAGTGCAPERRRRGFTCTGRHRLRCDRARGAGWARHPRLSHRGCRALQEPPSGRYRHSGASVERVA